MEVYLKKEAYSKVLHLPLHLELLFHWMIFFPCLDKNVYKMYIYSIHSINVYIKLTDRLSCCQTVVNMCSCISSIEQFTIESVGYIY